MPDALPDRPPPWPGYVVETPRLRIYLRRTGQRDGEKLVLLHGWAVHGGMFEALRKHLEEEFDLLVPDIRGHGLTEAPRDGYSMESFADDLAGLLDAQGIEAAHVAGYSMGGFAALAFAHRHPSRLRRLGLLCTAARQNSARRRFCLRLIEGIWTLAPPSAMLHVTRQTLTGPDLPEWMDEALPWLMQHNSRAGLVGGARSLRLSRLEEVLPHIRHPSLVVTGGKDTAVKERDWRELVECIPGVVHHHFEQAGHGLAASHHDELGTTLRNFLRAPS
ncbi:MAG: alpha/beta fold hydrolase [Myxococcota bacterium]|nr:alpha/beta fold hydrolase [Myxococcota bacterium]